MKYQQISRFNKHLMTDKCLNFKNHGSICKIGVITMLEFMNQEEVFNIALAVTILIWVLIGGAYFQLVVDNRIVN